MPKQPPRSHLPLEHQSASPTCYKNKWAEVIFLLLLWLNSEHLSGYLEEGGMLRLINQIRRYRSILSESEPFCELIETGALLEDDGNFGID